MTRTNLILTALTLAGLLVAAGAAIASDAGPDDTTAAAPPGAVDPSPPAALPDPGSPPVSGAEDATSTLSPAEAAARAPVKDDPAGIFLDLVNAARAKNWWLVFSLTLMLLVLGLRWALSDWSRFKHWVLESQLGGPLFTFGISFLGMLSTTAAAAAQGGAGPSWADVRAAAVIGLGAIGGWHMAKRLARWAWAKVSG
jgi:hypothetical protein